MNLETDIRGYSQGLYSSWYYWKNAHILIDCGDGCAARLGPSCASVRNLLLTHGHIDHISSLPALLWARSASMGETQKTLPVYFPKGDPYVANMREFLEHVGKDKFKIGWHELEAGETFTLGKRDVETFPTNHMETPTIGYQFIEWKKVLKPEFEKLTRDEIIAHRMDGTFDQISEKIGEVIAAFCGDSLPVNADHIRGSKIIFHEATALNNKDLGEKNHSTLESALKVGIEAEPQDLVLTHYSSRYSRGEFASAAKKMALEMEVPFRVWCFVKDENRLVYEPTTSEIQQGLN
jgi:ribonuclease Z